MSGANSDSAGTPEDALPLSTVLKLAGVVDTGGQAKVLIQAGDRRPGKGLDSGGRRARQR